MCVFCHNLKRKLVNVKPFNCFLLFIIALLISACGKDSCRQMSNVTVNTPISRGEHLDVYAVGGHVYAQGGVCGLIVYNTGSGLVAYDRCSTVGSGNSPVKVEGLTIVDPTSGAKWLLMDGSPAAVATCSLWRYTVVSAGDIYYVRN